MPLSNEPGADDPAVALLTEALPRLRESFAGLPPYSEAAATPEAHAVLAEVAERLGDNYPYFHPLYAGQMLKPPHPVARAAYALAMVLNPNNHALDGGRASSRMEVEAVRGIAAVFGWREYLGHLTTGGTFANLEALWVAGQLHRGKRVVASAEAHYTHSRISGVLRLPFTAIRSDRRGRMDIPALESELERGDVGTVVVTLGTTGTGAVDALDRVLALRAQHEFRIHIDAAYGGYFALAGNLAAETRRAFDCVGDADSIVVDPHKHGLQPYGCGCVLFRDPNVGRFYKHDSPYTYFTSESLHLGEISLECSRAGASAVALWATMRLLPPVAGGGFAGSLEAGRRAALALYAELQDGEPGDASLFVTAFSPELDIVVWAVRGANAATSSALAGAIFHAAAARHELHLALVRIPVRFFPDGSWEGADGSELVTCLRSVLMKPEHEHWLPEIVRRLKGATREVLGAV